MNKIKEVKEKIAKLLFDWDDIPGQWDELEPQRKVKFYKKADEICQLFEITTGEKGIVEESKV